MKTKDLGASKRVSVSASEVARFNASWPCSSLPVRSCWFEFDDRNGDLVDLSDNLRDVDGAEVSALAQDALSFYRNP